MVYSLVWYNVGCTQMALSQYYIKDKVSNIQEDRSHC